MVYHEGSLLWLAEEDTYFELEKKTLEDLNMSKVIVSLKEQLTSNHMGLLKEVPTSEATILYRQEIMEDFVKNKGLLETLVGYMERATGIQSLIKFAFQSEANLYNLLSRLDEVWEVMYITEHIYDALMTSTIQSRGLKKMGELIYQAIGSDIYQDFKSDIRQIRRMKEGIKCLKVGINVDEYLRPKEVIVISAEEEAFRYTRRMKKTGKIIGYGLSQIKSIPRKIFAPDSLRLPDALNNLERVLAPSMGDLISFCETFNKGLLEIYGPILGELSFYSIGYKIYRKMIDKGLDCVKPNIAYDMDTRIHSLYNLNLAYDLMERQSLQELVTNDFTMTPGNLFILTGANRGGKTTFTQGIGQIYLLGQLGFYVPAKEAHMKLVDGLFTHFPTTEVETVYNGRLGEECARFSKIFSRMSRRGLLLMNESFDGTSHGESLMIAMDTLRAIGHLGANVIFNTHLHELGQRVQELNSELTKAKAVSLVTQLRNKQAAFKIREGEPEGKSYAEDIAVKYGVSYEQLVDV